MITVDLTDEVMKGLVATAESGGAVALGKAVLSAYTLGQKTVTDSRFALVVDGPLKEAEPKPVAVAPTDPPATTSPLPHVPDGPVEAGPDKVLPQPKPHLGPMEDGPVEQP